MHTQTNNTKYSFDTNIVLDDPDDVVNGRAGSYGFSLGGKLTAAIAKHAIASITALERPLIDTDTGEVKEGLDGIDKFSEMMSQLDALGAEVEGEFGSNETHEQAIAGFLHARNLLKQRGVKVGSFVEHFKWRAEQAAKNANDEAMITALAAESGLPIGEIRKARAAKGQGQVQWILTTAAKAMQVIGKTQPDPHYTPEDFKDMYLDSLKSARLQAVRNSNNLAEARATLLLLKACEERADRQLPAQEEPAQEEPVHDVDASTVEFDVNEHDSLVPSYEDQVAALEAAHENGSLGDDEFDALMVNLRGG